MKQSEIDFEVKKLKQLQVWIAFNTPDIDEYAINTMFHRKEWIIICDLEDAAYFKKYYWRIDRVHGKYYIRFCKRIKNKIIMLYLPRLIMGLQDNNTGETLEGKENLIVEIIEEKSESSCVFNLQKKNLRLTTRSLQSYKREAEKQNWGISKLPNGKIRIRIFFPGNKNPLYIGSNYSSVAEAMESRDIFIKDQKLENIIPLSNIKVLHQLDISKNYGIFNIESLNSGNI